MNLECTLVSKLCVIVLAVCLPVLLFLKLRRDRSTSSESKTPNPANLLLTRVIIGVVILGAATVKTMLGEALMAVFFLAAIVDFLRSSKKQPVSSNRR